VGVHDINVLLDRMPPLLLAIAEEVMATCPQISIVARDVAAADLPAAVAAKRPDVVLLGSASSVGNDDTIGRLLGPADANRRIVTIFGTDRTAHLHAWRHSVTILDHLSVDLVRSAILGTVDG